MKYRLILKENTIKSISKVWKGDPSKTILFKHDDFTIRFYCDNDIKSDYYLGFEKDAYKFFRYNKVESDENVFVIMPFSKKIVPQNVYSSAIRISVQDNGLNCIRVDEDLKSTSIINKVFSYILRSKLVIADLTGYNPNVFYELGLAHALNKDVIQLIQQDVSKIPFDLSGITTIKYDKKNINALKDKLNICIAKYLRDRE
jgi:hypothetical protein